MSVSMATATPEPRPAQSNSRRAWLRTVRNGASAVGWLLLSLAAGGVGSFFMPDSWYASLRKPPWNPPGWVFGPVWTALYVLMGLAAWRLSRTPASRTRSAALGLFVVQLVANAAWTWLFFGLRRPDLAFVDIAVLWALLAVLISLARHRDRTAAWMLVPYIAWVTYASTLNGAIWVLNR